jgi:hypothetical protein
MNSATHQLRKICQTQPRPVVPAAGWAGGGPHTVLAVHGVPRGAPCARLTGSSAGFDGPVRWSSHFEGGDCRPTSGRGVAVPVRCHALGSRNFRVFRVAVDILVSFISLGAWELPNWEGETGRIFFFLEEKLQRIFFRENYPPSARHLLLLARMAYFEPMTGLDFMQRSLL